MTFGVIARVERGHIMESIGSSPAECAWKQLEIGDADVGSVLILPFGKSNNE